MMNMMSMVLVALVAFTYFGGQNVPKVLKDNKQMLLGVFVGVLLHQFMGIGVEGYGDISILSNENNCPGQTDICKDCIGWAKCSGNDPDDVCFSENEGQTREESAKMSVGFCNAMKEKGVNTYDYLKVLEYECEDPKPKK